MLAIYAVQCPRGHWQSMVLHCLWLALQEVSHLSSLQGDYSCMAPQSRRSSGIWSDPCYSHDSGCFDGGRSRKLSGFDELSDAMHQTPIAAVWHEA
jgi:hypothetical protein